MVRFSRTGMLALFWGLLASHTFGQDSTSSFAAKRDSLIAEVLRTNPGLQAFRAEASGAETRIPQSNAWEDPQITVSFMDNPTSSANFLRDGMERQYGILQMVPFPGKKSAAEDAATSGAQAAWKNVQARERILISEVKIQFAMLYSAQRRIEVNAEDQQLLGQMISSVQSKYSVGLASQADVLRLQIELSKLENQRATLEHELRVPEAMLNTLRSQPMTAPIGRIGDMTLVPFRFQLAPLSETALASRNELSAMNFELAMKQSELRMAERERVPDLMFGGVYRQRVGFQDTWDVMFGISVPIAPWVSGKYSGKVEEREYGVQQGEDNIRDARNMIRFEVFDSWAKAKAHWEQADRFQTSIIPEARQALQALLSAYQTNKADFLSLLDSFRTLQMFRMEY
ncbi:MAG: TolC family protein, partial [Bacteroidota bacterium]